MMSPPFSSVVGWLQIPWSSQDSCSWVGEVGCDSSLNFLSSDFWDILSCTEVVHDVCTAVSPSLGSSCISKFVNKSKSTNGCLLAVSRSLNLTLTLSTSLLFYHSYNWITPYQSLVTPYMILVVWGCLLLAVSCRLSSHGCLL